MVAMKGEQQTDWLDLISQQYPMQDVPLGNSGPPLSCYRSLGNDSLLGLQWGGGKKDSPRSAPLSYCI